jgi:hypothetical protein
LEEKSQRIPGRWKAEQGIEEQRIIAEKWIIVNTLSIIKKNPPFEGPTVTNRDEEETSRPFHRALTGGIRQGN